MYRPGEKYRLLAAMRGHIGCAEGMTVAGDDFGAMAVIISGDYYEPNPEILASLMRQ